MKFSQIAFALAMVWTTVLFTSCTTEEVESNIATEDVFIPEPKAIELDIMHEINNYRISIGLDKLEHLDIIKSQTFLHSDYMRDNNVLTHANFETRQAFLESHAGADKVGENVAFGYSTAQQVVEAWLSSAGHKENIEGDFSHFEVSAETNEEGHLYFTNIFIRK